MREQRFVRSNSLLRQICDQLWSQLSFSFLTVFTTVNTRALQNVHLQVQNLFREIKTQTPVEGDVLSHGDRKSNH